MAERGETIYEALIFMKKLLYIHGFGSSGSTSTVDWLSSVLPDMEVSAPDLPMDGPKALEVAKRAASDEKPNLIVGTSMGGMIAEQLYGFDRILINPAFEIAETIRTNIGLGRHEFFNKRRDGATDFLITKKTLEGFREVSGQCFSGVTATEQKRVYGLFGLHDELVHTLPIFLNHYTQAIRFDGGHRMDDHVRRHALLPLIRRIDDLQQHRERPLLYVELDGVLRKADGRPLGSAVHAFGHLAETYDMRIVANVSWHEPERMAEAQQWVEQWLGVAAWQKMVFTPEKRLIYGDYLLSSAPCPEFLGTTLIYGSPEFRSWEDVLTFFERLGGQ